VWRFGTFALGNFFYSFTDGKQVQECLVALMSLKFLFALGVFGLQATLSLLELIDFG
jgi:hypothetical protein